MAYKQKFVPEVDNSWDNYSLGELKKVSKQHYIDNFENTSIINLSNGVRISFGKSGIKHVLNFGKAGYTKYKMIQVLSKAVEVAEFKNFSKPDLTDGRNILGYMNYVVRVKVENKVQKFRIVVRMTNEGKFYYNHSVRIYL